MDIFILFWSLLWLLYGGMTKAMRVCDLVLASKVMCMGGRQPIQEGNLLHIYVDIWKLLPLLIKLGLWCLITHLHTKYVSFWPNCHMTLFFDWDTYKISSDTSKLAYWHHVSILLIPYNPLQVANAAMWCWQTQHKWTLRLLMGLNAQWPI